MTHRNGTSKFIGCEAAHTAGAFPDTADARVRQVLQGFDYGPGRDPETKRDRQRHIADDLRRVKDDMADLMARVRTYQADYGDNAKLIDALYAAADAFRDEIQDNDAEYRKHMHELYEAAELDRLWQFRNHYGCEPADYR